MPVWPWGGHRGWSYDLVRFMRPSVICELGVHWGTSLFAFAQAVKDAKFKSTMIGIDTWAGDGHTGPYGPDVLETVRTIASRFFAKQSFELRPMTFDEALPSVPDGSVDLLHIDGFHTYAAVKHDFESWLPKLAPDGVVLLHDVADDTGYGSADYWKELLERFPGFNFEHSWGLGVVFPKGDKWITSLREHGLDDKVLLYTFRALLERSKIELRDTGAMAVERLAAMDEMGKIIGDRDGQLTVARHEADGLRRAIDEAAHTREGLQDELNRAATASAQQVREFTAQREGLESSIRALGDRVGQLQARGQELETNLGQTQAAAAQNLARAEGAESELAAVRSTLASVSDDLARALDREAVLRESKVEWEAVNRRLRAELASAAESVRALRARISGLELLLSQETARAAALGLELEEEGAMNRELSRSLDVVRTDVELMALRIEHLERIQIEREDAEKQANAGTTDGAKAGVKGGPRSASPARGTAAPRTRA